MAFAFLAFVASAPSANPTAACFAHVEDAVSCDEAHEIGHSEMKHKDSLTSLEWAAELGACAAQCRATTGCVTFISTLGTEGEWAECTFYESCEAAESVSLVELYSTSRYDVDIMGGCSPAAAAASRRHLEADAVDTEVEPLPLIISTMEMSSSWGSSSSAMGISSMMMPATSTMALVSPPPSPDLLPMRPTEVELPPSSPLAVSTPPSPPPPPSPPVLVTYSGIAMYVGPLKGCKVFADTNNNGVHDDGEPSTITGGWGGYSMQVEDSGNVPTFSVVPGGDCVDRYTGMELIMTLSAPADCPIISPLTNIKSIMDMHSSTDATVSSEEAFKNVLGLSDSDAEALSFETCTFNPLDQLWSGVGGGVGGGVGSGDDGSGDDGTTSNSQLLSRFQQVQMQVVVATAHIATVVGFASEANYSTAAEAVVTEAAKQIQADAAATAVQGSRRKLVIMTSMVIDTASMVVAAATATQVPLSDNMITTLAQTTTVAAEYASIRVGQAAPGDGEGALTELAKVAIAAQTGDQAVTAMLDQARADGDTNLDAIETRLSEGMIAAVTDAAMQAAVGRANMPEGAMEQATSPMPPPPPTMPTPSPPPPLPTTLLPPTPPLPSTTPPPLSASSPPPPSTPSPPLQGPAKPLGDDDDDTNQGLWALVLLVFLCPLCFLAYGFIAFGSKARVHRRYRLSHSNPSVSFLYMPKEARDNLRSELYATKGKDKEESDSDADSVDKDNKKKGEGPASQMSTEGAEAL